MVFPHSFIPHSPFSPSSFLIPHSDFLLVFEKCGHFVEVGAVALADLGAAVFDFGEDIGEVVFRQDHFVLGAGGGAEQEVAVVDGDDAFAEAAGVEVAVIVVLVLDELQGLLQVFSGLFERVEHLWGGVGVALVEFVETLIEEPAGDVADGGVELDLSGALVDGGDAGVAVEAFHLVVAHVAAAAEDLEGVVADLVAHLGGVVFDEGGEGGGEALEVAALSEQLLSAGHLLEFAGLLEFLDEVEHVDDLGGLVGEQSAGLDLHVHIAEHLADGGEVADGLSELFAGGGVFERLLQRRLGDADALGGDAEPGAVHQRHHVGAEATAAASDELGGGVVELQLAGG